MNEFLMDFEIYSNFLLPEEKILKQGLSLCQEDSFIHALRFLLD
jgi:hypothetical protein